MLVAYDTSPIKSGHQVRGIGAYTKNLLFQFQSNKYKDIDFTYFDDPKSPPQADIVHHPYFDLFFRTLSPTKSAKKVVTIHDVIPLVFPNFFPVGPKGFINLFFQKRALRSVDAIICDSKTSKADIVDKLSQDPKKVHVVYLAPAQIFRRITPSQNTAKKYKLPKDFVIFVGDVNWNKNIPNLIKAVSIANVNLVMVGKAIAESTLEETKQINKLIAKLGVGSKITKTGFVPDEDLVTIYNLASATILPSYYEGFGLPVLESMACGTPVVCSNAASLSEISGPDAFICDPNDPKDIAKKIEKAQFLSNKERETLSNKLMSHASKFTWEKTAKETVEIYQSLK